MTLEKLHSRIKQKAALCNWEELENSLVKRVFIQGMQNLQTQMDLLSEDRDPIWPLQKALARGGTRKPTKEPTQTEQHQRQSQSGQQMSNIQDETISNKNQTFKNELEYYKHPNRDQYSIVGNVDINLYQATLTKTELCRICRKIVNYAKKCKAEIPLRPTQRPKMKTNTQNGNIANTSQNNNYQQNTRRVRNINPSTTENTSQAGGLHSEENESLDQESTCYIREMMEDWSTVNLVNWK